LTIWHPGPELIASPGKKKKKRILSLDNIWPGSCHPEAILIKLILFRFSSETKWRWNPSC